MHQVLFGLVGSWLSPFPFICRQVWILPFKCWSGEGKTQGIYAPYVLETCTLQKIPLHLEVHSCFHCADQKQWNRVADFYPDTQPWCCSVLWWLHQLKLEPPSWSVLCSTLNLGPTVETALRRRQTNSCSHVCGGHVSDIQMLEWSHLCE